MHGRSCADANSYYIDKHGDFGFLRPTTAYQSTRASRRLDMGDFEFQYGPEPQAPTEETDRREVVTR